MDDLFVAIIVEAAFNLKNLDFADDFKCLERGWFLDIYLDELRWEKKYHTACDTSHCSESDQYQIMIESLTDHTPLKPLRTRWI